jgi:DNA-binding PadR family transcriptional regulator
MFEKGDLKYVVLDTLAERPRHGYDVISALEERFRGAYAPSPGSVYPILQMLEDLGHVSVEAREGRKVYTLTEEGRAFLAENRATVDAIWSRAEHRHGFASHEELHTLMHELRHEFKELGQLLARKAWGRQLTPDKIGRVREILTRARREIETLLMS